MDIASAAVVTRRLLVRSMAGLAAGACAVGAVACSSSGSSSPGTASGAPAASATSAGAGGAAGASPAGTESPPPGDIPDTTVYVAYRPASGQYELKVPEGWARTVTPGAVSFTDKLNVITISTTKASAPTVASARAAEVPRIQASAHGFTLAGIGTVSRSAGTAVLIRYSADSQPDPVTGKVYTDAVERYEFYRNGTEAAVTLTAPAGADNVDPWRTVTQSFRWLR
jgi:hypothetical protein